MSLLLFSKVCLYDLTKNETIIYGQYNKKFNSINIKPSINYDLVFNDNRPDFYIKLIGKINNLDNINFIFNDTNNNIKMINIELYFPFENCDLILNNNSAIISTICKDYSYRLDEWIQYNLKLGFSGIVIFNNDFNKSNGLNESLEHCVLVHSTDEICKKYKGKVWVVDLPYSPFNNSHWNTIQRITLHIGVNAFRNKCRNIALIDADEFIYIPKNPSIRIETFLNDHGTITLQSNILTNKNNNDILNNNILQIAEYVGDNMYTKTIIYTGKISENEWINTPHNHYSEKIMNKEEIIHYHCWMNNRYHYNNNMKKIDFLKKFMNN